MGELKRRLPNGVEPPPKQRCSAQSALCSPRDHLDSQELQGRSQQIGSLARAVGSTGPRLDWPPVFAPLPGDYAQTLHRWPQGSSPIPEACTADTLRAGPQGYATTLGDRMGIPAQADGWTCLKGFPIFPKPSSSDTPQSSCNLIPGQLRAKSRVPVQAHGSHLPIQSLGPTPTYPEAKTPCTYTHRHPHQSAKPLPGGAKRAWVQQAPP